MVIKEEIDDRVDNFFVVNFSHKRKSWTLLQNMVIQ